MSHQTLVILSVSAGSGHLRAAEALKATAEQDYQDVHAIHIDVMELVSDQFRQMYAGSYISIVEHHPSLWGYLYRAADHQKVDSPLGKMRRAIERLNTRKLDSTLAVLKPDYVICTHFLPVEMLSRMMKKGTFTRPAWVVDTDFDVHTMWIHPGMSGYFMADEEVAWRLRDRGVDAHLIHVTGIPIMPVFSQQLDRVTCAQELGIDPDKRTLLLMSGGFGLSGTEKLAERLLQLCGEVQIIVIAGKNEELFHTLQELAVRYPRCLFPLQFTNTIERVMAASDLAITKPGGLTSSECLAMGLPMIVISPIPGQEERNADYLLEHGAALKAYDVAGLEYRVKSLLEHPQRLVEMRQRLQGIGKPHAARDILRIALGR
jgi:processive 1,2-diacylglycerol beta-glucosyltransferase